MRNIGISLLAAAALALPAAAKSAAKAQVTCTDGTTSKAGRGACSHHGGVAKSDEKSDKAAKSETRAEKKEESKKSSGGVLDGIFGRKKSDTAQGRSPGATPRSSTREGKSTTPTARCKDGTTSYSAHHSGTCSGHGGVDQWLDK
jgi:hypothetical protein